jgi:hypothetical protein
MKFSAVRDRHLQRLDNKFFDNAVFVLGIDQGPKNFGATLTAFDGDRVVSSWDYYNSDTTTMKRNLTRLRGRVPRWIQRLGGNPANWLITITDVDPPLFGTFEEIEEDGLKWPTEIITRHRNNARIGDNWRRELQEFVNVMAKRDRLVFHIQDDLTYEDDETPGGDILHDQVMQVVDKPDDPEKESRGGYDKGWLVSDPLRGDHVLDAWYFTLWAIYSQQVKMPESHGKTLDPDDPWADQKAAFEYRRERQEQRELSGYVEKRTPDESFEDKFGYKRSGFKGILAGYSHYGDEA